MGDALDAAAGASEGGILMKEIALVFLRLALLLCAACIMVHAVCWALNWTYSARHVALVWIVMGVWKGTRK